MPLTQVETKKETIVHNMDTVLSFGMYKGRKVRDVIYGYEMGTGARWMLWAYTNIYWFDMTLDVQDAIDEVMMEYVVDRYADYRDNYEPY